MSSNKVSKISAVNIAFLYVGALMGAGFASGREIWQFFGVFGEKSYQAVFMITLLFIFFGLMAIKISDSLHTTDIGKIVMPFENERLGNIIGIVMAAILFLIYVVMAAAGGALFQEQFGIHRVFGGLLMMLMVAATALGGFDRISKYFKYIIPVLLVIVFLVCFSLVFLELPASGIPAERMVSPLTPNWFVSAAIYISYNMLAGIPILANSTARAKSRRAALIGAALGGLILGLAAFVMNLAMQSDPGLTSASVLPILALSGKLSGGVRWIYAVLLLFAVYASATSNFYGFTTKIRDGKHKKGLIVLACVIGFLLSLFGFADIIAFVLPFEGYCGLLFLAGITIHFFRIKKKKNQQRFQFAGGIKRVTAGTGGEALLITGSEKTVLIDCGMAYCGEALVENIKRELGDRPLDYVILTHTHYDHIGGLPYLRKEWPDLISFGAAYGKKILEKDTALQQIRKLSEGAWRLFTGRSDIPDVLMEGLQIDRIICENDVIYLGDQELQIFETPGHTNCSLTLLLEPEKVLFPSETIGVYVGEDRIVPAMLKSYEDTIASIEKCRGIEADYVISPHYGQVSVTSKESYLDMAFASLNRARDFILEKHKEGGSFEEILEEYTKEFYIDPVSVEQPREAFLLNAQHMIRNMILEFRDPS